MSAITAETEQALKLLRTMAECNEMFITLSQELRVRPEVVRVLHSLEARKHPPGAAIEGYVDAELRSGKAVCWWVDAYWEEGRWVIEYSILVNDTNGQTVLKEFPATIATTVDEFTGELQKAIHELASNSVLPDILV